MKILVINPGSTSTKLAVFEKGNVVLENTLRHSSEELEGFDSIIDQYNFRADIIKNFLNDNSHKLNSFDCIIGRGGLLKPIESGVYCVNEKMVKDLKSGEFGDHASNLGGLLALELSNQAKCKAFIADPVVVDEMQDIARISGIPELERISIFHALNQKAVAKRAANELKKDYNNINLIVVHLGGGISVGAHSNGRVIDVNNALDGDGPFSPERSGGLPVGGLVKMCYSGKYTIDDIKKKLKGKGGLVAYLKTNNAQEIQQMIKNGDKNAELVYKAMAYQIAKEIGALSCVLKGKVDAIVLTGGIAHDKTYLIPWIKERVDFISKVIVYPGENEMEALYNAGLEGLKDEKLIKEYC
ncbi:MAG: butyrate kinase [Candidatus Muirbacterium halophilum]|nr:butyrate kinase [Candidatus Muirbacterium halophilum]